MIVALPVQLLCVITNQNACAHSTTCSQHYVYTRMQNIIISAQNIIAVTFRTASLAKRF